MLDLMVTKLLTLIQVLSELSEALKATKTERLAGREASTSAEMTIRA